MSKSDFPIERPCFVYFIQAFKEAKLQQVKIGYTYDVSGRLASLQTGSAVKLTLIGAVKCKNEFYAQSLERRLHNMFHKQRRRGEWFRLSEAQNTAIMNICNGGDAGIITAL